jgi:type IV fimbrial biogenesis protein FimT
MAFDFDRQTLETQFVNEVTTHHAYHFANKGVVIDEPSAGSEIVFYPSGRSATATTIRLHGKEGQMKKVTVSITGRVAIQ